MTIHELYNKIVADFCAALDESGARIELSEETITGAEYLKRWRAGTP